MIMIKSQILKFVESQKKQNSTYLEQKTEKKYSLQIKNYNITKGSFLVKAGPQ